MTVALESYGHTQAPVKLHDAIFLCLCLYYSSFISTSVRIVLYHPLGFNINFLHLWITRDMTYLNTKFPFVIL
jgi:hypothetical protein